ncbi:MAG: hypothetical protein JRN62_03620 [Nitrososphaerota archaeon]|jgi:hypothetical protein|nr:hypothetical protein [Nitrososphaerota archaeon]MDG6948690.1 hypothetical protein [Nitrososphaerota archaeon]
MKPETKKLLMRYGARLGLYVVLVLPIVLWTYNWPDNLTNDVVEVAMFSVAMTVARLVIRIPSSAEISLSQLGLKGRDLAVTSKNASSALKAVKQGRIGLEDGSMPDEDRETLIEQIADDALTVLERDIGLIRVLGRDTRDLVEDLDILTSEVTSMEASAIRYWLYGKVRNLALRVSSELSHLLSERMGNSPTRTMSGALISEIDEMRYHA